jgi:CRP/FNR family transcriptional regulator, anaerobic regulatory protein
MKMRGRAEILSSVFREGESGYFRSGETLIAAGTLPRFVYQLRTGLAYQSCWFSDGRRAIVDIFAPGDVLGLETILSLRAAGSVAAAGLVKYLAVDANTLHQLTENREVALCFTSLFVEARRRSEELAARIARLEAPERVAATLVDLYDRLRRRRMIARSTFNLYLTQQQLGDHLGLTGVHVNRVLRWFAREDIAFVARSVVIIRDMPRLRRLARGEEAIETRRTKLPGNRIPERVSLPRQEPPERRNEGRGSPRPGNSGLALLRRRPSLAARAG